MVESAKVDGVLVATGGLNLCIIALVLISGFFFPPDLAVENLSNLLWDCESFFIFLRPSWRMEPVRFPLLNAPGVPLPAD